MVCGRCGQGLVSLEPHTCPPSYVNLPNQPPQPAVSISLGNETGQVVSCTRLVRDMFIGTFARIVVFVQNSLQMCIDCSDT